MMPLQQALQIAQEQGLDLVAVAPKTIPPVCRVLDYGRYKYEQAKKERKAKQSQKAALLKEVRFRPRIEKHDLNVKMEKVKEFLEEGSKVRIWLRLRGREIIYPDQGWKVLHKVAEAFSDIAAVTTSSSDARNMALILTPISAKKSKKEKVNAEAQNS